MGQEPGRGEGFGRRKIQGFDISLEPLTPGILGRLAHSGIAHFSNLA
jgi:hypothetical protein